MGGVSSGALSPQAIAAKWRGKRETGGSLFAAGAAAWLVHSILMVLGLVLIFSISLTDFEAATQTVFAGLATFIAATVAVLLATFLLGAGLLVYQGGTPGLAMHEWWSGVTRQVSPSTRTRAKAGAALVIAYGVLGILVIAIYAWMATSAQNLDFQAILNGIQMILLLWIVASILLMAGSALIASFLNSLRVETASHQSIGGIGFLAYAILSAIGVLLFAGSLMTIFTNPLSAQVGLVIPIMVGAVIGLLVVPIMGMVVFGLMIAYGLRLRKWVTGSQPAPGPYPPPARVPGQYPAPPAAPQMVPPSPAAGAGRPVAVPMPVPFAAPANPLPPPPGVGATFANPPAPVPPPAPGPAAVSESWVMRMETQIEGLQRTVNEQKDRILELEHEIADTKNRLVRPSVAPPKDDGLETPGPPEDF